MDKKGAGSMRATERSLTAKMPFNVGVSHCHGHSDLRLSCCRRWASITRNRHDNASSVSGCHAAGPAKARDTSLQRGAKRMRCCKGRNCSTSTAMRSGNAGKELDTSTARAICASALRRRLAGAAGAQGISRRFSTLFSNTRAACATRPSTSRALKSSASTSRMRRARAGSPARSSRRQPQSAGPARGCRARAPQAMLPTWEVLSFW
mmetsp:Transcript_21218/g.68676  ORF Transcript_21218/g.68676 Transcript_21218/m.68676 type:complete len:207 (+) Transcript_21218:845-1465(+)